MVVNKGKQKEEVIQDKEVFLYKPYTMSLELSRPTTPEPKEEVNNLEKVLANTILFLLLAYYYIIQT